MLSLWETIRSRGQKALTVTILIDLTNATLAEWAMNNGLNANIKSMTQAEKTMLRYQYVMAQTTNAQGDFTRTARKLCAA